MAAPIIPARLREALTGGKLIPFLGAGFSLPSGLPSWADLMTGLENRFHDDDISSEGAPVGKIPPPDLAEVLDSLHVTEHNAYTHFIEAIDDPECKPNAYHAFLSQLNVGTIITTNWDSLIEEALRSTGHRVHVIRRDSDVSLYDPGTHVEVIKIHGSITDASSLVYRKSQYNNFWEHRPLLFSLLTTLLGTNNVLFLGYGFGDPNILELLERLRSLLGSFRREHWALSYGDPSLERIWRLLGVEVLPATRFDVLGDPFAATSRLLAELVANTGSVSFSNLDRARLVNRELNRLLGRGRHVTLRMRGELGWLSNPVPDPGDPIYGSAEQDAVERDMTELILQILQRDPGSKVRCLLHLSARSLLIKYPAEHIRRRLETLAEIIASYPTQVEVAHTGQPSHVNQMIFDQDASLLGFKNPGIVGIRRAFVIRDKQTVRDEVAQFDGDFKEISDGFEAHATEDEQAISSDEAARMRANALHIIRGEIEWLEELASSAEGQVLPSSITQHPGSLAQASPREALESFADAVSFAMKCHGRLNQTREDGTTPYIVHPLRVVERLRMSSLDGDYEFLSAAILHDVVEDCGVELPEISNRFGSRVSLMVEQLSHGDNQSREEYLLQLARSSQDSMAIKLADRWDNVSELRIKRYPSFGEMSVAEYLEYSEQVLAVCSQGSDFLASHLKTEIAATRSELTE
jgi:hypothetical protein